MWALVHVQERITKEIQGSAHKNIAPYRHLWSQTLQVYKKQMNLKSVLGLYFFI